MLAAISRLLDTQAPELIVCPRCSATRFRLLATSFSKIAGGWRVLAWVASGVGPSMFYVSRFFLNKDEPLSKITFEKLFTRT